MYIITCEIDRQSSFDAWDRAPRASALGWPWGMGWGGRSEGGSGWGTHVHPWLIHVNVWQKPLQYCKVISFQLKLKEKNLKKRIRSYSAILQRHGKWCGCCRAKNQILGTQRQRLRIWCVNSTRGCSPLERTETRREQETVGLCLVDSQESSNKINAKYSSVKARMNIPPQRYE